MVIAEVPLWIWHGNASSSSSSVIPTSTLLSHPAGTSLIDTNATTSKQKQEKKIQQNLQLWDPLNRLVSPSLSSSITTGNNRNRSAIYCCDITCGSSYRAEQHPGGKDKHYEATDARLATGGGDGCIKIWRFDALFQLSKDDDHKQDMKPPPPPPPPSHYRMATFDKVMGYMSSDESFTTLSTKSSSSSSSSSNPLKSTSNVPIGSLHASSTKDCDSRLVCTLSSHSGSVLTLRFSTFGSYLASGGDDSSIFIYTRCKQPQQETWNRLYILRGHNLDVVGLAWAPDDSYLISCSLDSQNPIGVWNLPSSQQTADNTTTISTSIGATNSWIAPTVLRPFRILGRKEHSSTVKGVAFDPAGRYIISSGDDPAVCIWRVEDWGLDRKIDASNSEIFPSSFHRRTTKTSTKDKDNASNSSHVIQEMDEQDRNLQVLSSLSLFRRISFAPDGSHVSVTNATLRGKNIAAMISRDDNWAVSGSGDLNSISQLKEASNKANGISSHSVPAVGAANLVGHKQPVVCSRHCPYLLKASNNQTDFDDEEENLESQPNYATLVALGDKKGFITVWSTKKSRPIFKLQCGENQNTVTDMTWGLLPSTGTIGMSLVLVISLLDGFITALRFQVPDEVGPLLSESSRHKIFRYKYGIDFKSILSSVGNGTRKRWVDDKSGPKLLENILPFEMDNIEENEEDLFDPTDKNMSNGHDNKSENLRHASTSISSTRLENIQSQHTVEHLKGGKKRIRPTLLIGNNAQANQTTSEHKSLHEEKDDEISKKQPKKSADPVKDVLDDAEKAISLAENLTSKVTKREVPINGQMRRTTVSNTTDIRTSSQNNLRSIIIPATKEKIHSVDLAVTNECPKVSMEHSPSQIVVGSCVNSIETIPGSNKSIPCIGVSITRGSTVSWRDMIYGATCTCIASSSNIFAIGTLDGSLYLYSTSSSSGWLSGIGYRSHPPIIFSHSIARLSCKQEKRSGTNGCNSPNSTILVLSSDGSFGVLTVYPSLKLLYKGNITTPMNHIRQSAYGGTQQQLDLFSSGSPHLSKIQLTDSNHLLIILSSAPSSSTQMIVAGGPIHAFAYNFESELWMRIADNRFVFSDFYSSIPGKRFASEGQVIQRVLGSIEDAVLCEPSRSHIHRKGILSTDYTSTGMYNSIEEDGQGQYLVTRAHCEDRMSCALALGSTKEFLYWLRLYVRNLSYHGSSTHLRYIVDIFLGQYNENNHMEDTSSCPAACPWLISYKIACGVDWDAMDILRTIILPEMIKNSALHRLVNEIDTELKLYCRSD